MDNLRIMCERYPLIHRDNVVHNIEALYHKHGLEFNPPPPQLGVEPIVIGAYWC